MDTAANPNVIDETKPKRGPGGLFAKKETSEKPPKIEYIGVEEPKRGRGRPKGVESKPASSSAARPKPKPMTPKKAREMLAGTCAVVALVSRNNQYMLNPLDDELHADTYQAIADGMNALPDWLRSSVEQGGGIAGLVAGVAIFGMTKRATATGQLKYEDVLAAKSALERAA